MIRECVLKREWGSFADVFPCMTANDAEAMTDWSLPIEVFFDDPHGYDGCVFQATYYEMTGRWADVEFGKDGKPELWLIFDDKSEWMKWKLAQ